MSAFPPRPAESFAFKDITYRKQDWVATVAINRPGYHNAYSTLALQWMIQAFTDTRSRVPRKCRRLPALPTIRAGWGASWILPSAGRRPRPIRLNPSHH